MATNSGSPNGLIKENLKEDSIKKPEILSDREKLDPRKYEAEVMGKVKEGSITRDEAQKKLGALREEMEKKLKETVWLV